MQPNAVEEASINDMQIKQDLLIEGSLAAVNEQFSDGQQTVSNNVIVEHRYSKASKTHIIDSTVHLMRASSTAFGLNTESQGGGIDSSNKLMMNESQQLDADRRDKNRSSQDLTHIYNGRQPRILNSLDLTKL